MQAHEAICAAVVVTIVFIIFTTSIMEIRIWSALVLSFIAGIAVMILLFPPTRLLNSIPNTGIVLYMGLIALAFVLVLVYTLIGCCLDVC